MAVAVTLVGPPAVAEFPGQIVNVRARVAFDSTYPAGGEAITAANFGLSSIVSLQLTQSKPITGTTANYATWDAANSKLQLFSSNGAAPAALLETATADQSACIVDVLVSGRV